MRQANSRNVRHSTRQRNEVTLLPERFGHESNGWNVSKGELDAVTHGAGGATASMAVCAMTAEHVSEISARSSVEARASRFLIPQLHGDAGYDPLNRFTDELKKLNRPWEAVGEQPDLLARREVSRQFIWNSWSGAFTAWIMKLHAMTLGCAAALAGTAASLN